jgi:hypothetical protein
MTQSGDVDIGDFCGFRLDARAETGDISADASCAPQDLSLRSVSGSVRVAVPRGRYAVEAESGTGRNVVRGLESVADAPFTIRALSSSGDVLVEDRA